MPEGLSATEVGKEIAEHREHAEHAEHAAHGEDGAHGEPIAGEHANRDRWVSIAEAVMLSIVALVAAWSGYSAAKWGLRGLTKSAALEFASANIRVNAMHPGLVETPIIDPESPFRKSRKLNHLERKRIG